MTLAEALPGSGGSRPFTEKSDVHNVAGKVFLIVTVKAEPEHGRRLPDEHPSITAGRFSARRATRDEGATLFDEIVEIMRDHGPDSDEAKDGIDLELL